MPYGDAPPPGVKANGLNAPPPGAATPAPDAKKDDAQEAARAGAGGFRKRQEDAQKEREKHAKAEQDARTSARTASERRRCCARSKAASASRAPIPRASATTWTTPRSPGNRQGAPERAGVVQLISACACARRRRLLRVHNQPPIDLDPVSSASGWSSPALAEQAKSVLLEINFEAA